MNQIRFIGLLLIIMSIVFFFGCQKDQSGISHDISNTEIGFEKLTIQSEGLIVLGKKLDNPYSVANMQQAYNNLLQDSTLTQSLNIRTTHLYIRYLPKTNDEEELLLSDSTLELFDYPLDYEISSGGTFFQDPQIAIGNVTWQYCVVENGYQFLPIQYEVLSNLFIPEYLEGEINEDDINYLVDEALTITNNNDIDTTNIKNTKGKWSKWSPSGYINCYDDIVATTTDDGMTPVVGAKVRARRWFIIKTDYTNSNGYFETGQFRRAVNYSIKWETSKYDIRNSVSIQAYFNGPKQREPWDLDISSGKSLRYATIHRAAYRYHFQNINGLKRPNVWRRLKINYIDDTGTGVNWGNNWQIFVPGSPVWPNIKIWGKKNNGDYKPTNDIYSTTIHEIGHSSHIELMNGGLIQFSQVSKQIYESWAEAIEWFITKIAYNDLGYSDYDDPDHYLHGDHKQWWTSLDSHDYTPIFIDLVDSYNQSIEKGELPTNRCPDGGAFDGSNCYIGSPPDGENAFIYADNFYHTPVECCNCPQQGTYFDGANCFKMDIPDNSIGFIWNNSWYLYPAGDTDYPYDRIYGYTMNNVEQILKHVYGLSSLRSKLKSNKPNGMTDKHIDVYLNYYFNL